jgi:hypothetical protein
MKNRGIMEVSAEVLAEALKLPKEVVIYHMVWHWERETLAIKLASDYPINDYTFPTAEANHILHVVRGAQVE